MIHLSHVINLTFGSFESLTTRSRRLFSLSLPFEMCLVKKKRRSVYKPTNKKNTILSSYELSHLCVSSTMGQCKGTILILKLILTWLISTNIDSVTRSDALPDDNSSLTAAVWHLQVRLDQSRVKSASYVISTRSWHKKPTIILSCQEESINDNTQIIMYDFSRNIAEM